MNLSNLEGKIQLCEVQGLTEQCGQHERELHIKKERRRRRVAAAGGISTAILG